MLAVANRGRCVRKELLQDLLALGENHAAQVVAIEIEQIESEIRQRLPPVIGRDRILQGLKTGAAFSVHDHDFAVKACGVHRQPRRRAGERREGARPVLGVARHHARLMIRDDA